MNEIKLKVNFTKRTIQKSGVALTTGDYNSTKLIFDFDREDGLKVFEMKNPNNELVLLSNIENNELILVGHDEDANVSLFTMPGDYIFEISLYDGDSKLTSASGKLLVKAETVLIDSEIYEPYTPIFENLINQVQNLNLDANRVEDGVELTIIKKDGTEITRKINDGEKGTDGENAKINGYNTLNIVAGDNITIEQEEETLTINAAGGSGGTGNYEELENKPQINGHILIGNQTTEDLELEYDDTEIKQDIEDLETEINIIDSKIPNQATSSNQLADKNFVNSSIATNTAYFRGTYESTSELPLTGNTPNDYAFVIIYDEVITTQVKQYDRYKWNNTQWVYEYTLNNSSFTAQQWASINSGITSGLVEKLDGIDLTDYVKNTDYATIAKAGIIGASGFYNTNVAANNGVLYAATNNYSTYQTKDNGAFISKGTLENVIAGKNLANKSYVDDSIASAITDTLGGSY